MLGVRLGIIFCFLSLLSGACFGNSAKAHSDSPFLDVVRRVAENVENIFRMNLQSEQGRNRFVEYINKTRNSLIENLIDSVAESETDINRSAKALKTFLALEGDPKLVDKELEELVSDLVTAVTAGKDTSAISTAKDALKKYLSHDAKGTDLTAAALQTAITNLQAADSTATAAAAAKALLKVLGPDGIKLLAQDNDNNISVQKLATALGIGNKDHPQAVAALEKELNALIDRTKLQIQLTSAPITATDPENPVSLGTGSPLPPAAKTTSEGTEKAVDSNKSLSDNFGNDDLNGGFDPAGDQGAFDNNIINDLQRQLAEQELENERLRNQNRNDAPRINANRPDNDKSTQFPPVSVNGGGQGKGPGEPPRPPEPMKPEPYPMMPMPPMAPQGNDSGLLVELIKSGLLGGNNSKDNKWDPTQSILNDINANSQRQLELANLNAMKQMLTMMSGMQPRNGLTTSKPRGMGPRLRDRIAQSQSRSRGRPRVGRPVPPLRQRANGPFLAGMGRAKQPPTSLRSVARLDSDRVGRTFAPRRTLKPRGRSMQ